VKKNSPRGNNTPQIGFSDFSFNDFLFTLFCVRKQNIYGILILEGISNYFAKVLPIIYVSMKKRLDESSSCTQVKHTFLLFFIINKVSGCSDGRKE